MPYVADLHHCTNTSAGETELIYLVQLDYTLLRTEPLALPIRITAICVLGLEFNAREARARKRDKQGNTYDYFPAIT